jgi:hypothetical protein
VAYFLKMRWDGGKEGETPEPILAPQGDITFQSVPYFPSGYTKLTPESRPKWGELSQDAVAGCTAKGGACALRRKPHCKFTQKERMWGVRKHCITDYLLSVKGREELYSGFSQEVHQRPPLRQSQSLPCGWG